MKKIKWLLKSFLSFWKEIMLQAKEINAEHQDIIVLVETDKRIGNLKEEQEKLKLKMEKKLKQISDEIFLNEERWKLAAEKIYSRREKNLQLQKQSQKVHQEAA
jgi:hypothetical protein